MSLTAPQVSLGLPVYNGEAYLAETLECVLSQTFPDFEVIVSDNSSTDQTEQICRDYAAADARIRYYRAEKNQGVWRNYNRVFALSQGKYFKWVAHDDLMAPTFLERTVAALDEHPDAVLSMPRVAVINEEGRLIFGDVGRGTAMSTGDILTDDWFPRRGELLASSWPHWRYLGVLVHSMRCQEVFALIRADALRQTPLMRFHLNSEKVLLAELAILGKYHEVPEVLFYSRWHSRRFSGGDPAERREAYCNARSRIVWPHQPRCALGYFLVPWQHRLRFGHRVGCMWSFVRFLLQVGRYGDILQRALRGKGMSVGLPKNVKVGRRPANVPVNRRLAPQDSAVTCDKDKAATVSRPGTTVAASNLSL